VVNGTRSLPSLPPATGFAFDEDAVAARYLAALLGEGYAPGIEGRTVRRVALQLVAVKEIGTLWDTDEKLSWAQASSNSSPREIRPCHLNWASNCCGCWICYSIWETVAVRCSN
jgi:hypothetical protein